MNEGAPSILILSRGEADPAWISEICAGVEEEGVPFDRYTVEMGTDANEIASNAAERSALGAGIGVAGSTAAFTLRSLTEGGPLFSAETNGSGFRLLGSNAARAVKGVAFKCR